MSNALILKALEGVWGAIQGHHPDVPTARLVLGSGVERKRYVKHGHWWPEQWKEGEEPAHEVLLSAEHLSDGAAQVLDTLLHEAAHGVAYVRGIKDVSRGNRWHNERFKKLAEELGCIVEKSEAVGHRTVGPTEEALARYKKEVEALAAAIRDAYRVRPAPPGEKKEGTRKKYVDLSCDCERQIRVEESFADDVGVTCSFCEASFVRAKK